MAEFWNFAARHSWAIDMALIIFLLWCLHKFSHVHLSEIIGVLAKEFGDVLKGNISIGALNAMAMIFSMFMGLAGLAMIILIHTEQLVFIRMTEIQKQAFPVTILFIMLFIFVWTVLLGSMWIHNRLNR